MRDRPPRTTAEWVTFGVALTLLLGVLAAVAVLAVAADAPAQPVAEVDGAPEQRGGRFHVAVRVRNDGDRAAEAVQVLAELTVGGETTEAEQELDFLSGGEEEDLVFVFDQDPAGGELDVRVGSYARP